MIPLLLAVALAAPDAWPWRVDLDLPAGQPARVTLPADTEGRLDPAAAAPARLEDAAGNPVPLLLRRSTEDVTVERVPDLEPVARNAWEIEGSDLPVDELVLEIDDLETDGPFEARLSVPGPGGGWVPAGPAVVLFDLPGDGGRRDTLPAFDQRGPFRVELVPFGDAPPYLRGVRARSRGPEAVAPLVETVEAPSVRLLEDGWARYVVALPGPRAVRAVRFEVDDEVFDREVRVAAASAGEPGGMKVVGSSEFHAEYGPTPTGRVQRARVGAARLDDVEVRVEIGPTDTLWIDVATDLGRVLPVRSFVVESVAVELVVRDPGPGPQALYLGGADDTAGGDLGVAAGELVRLAGLPRTAASVVANPGWIPVPTRDGLDAAGPLVNARRFRWRRPVEGPEGWLRVRLDAHVLAEAREGLEDLRVVDAEGRGLPFLTREVDREEEVALGPIERVERGGYSELRLAVPDGDLPLASISLETSATRFDRAVEVVRDRGRVTETVRAVQWRSEEQGGRLVLAMNTPVGETLGVRIVNGDDPPLPITAVRATRIGRELRFRNPGPGSAILYGGPGVEPPDFDLALVRGEVERLPVGEGTLGAVVAADEGTLGTGDRVVVGVAVGVLALGLGALVLRAAREAPSGEPPSPEAGSTG